MLQLPPTTNTADTRHRNNQSHRIIYRKQHNFAMNWYRNVIQRFPIELATIQESAKEQSKCCSSNGKRKEWRFPFEYRGIVRAFCFVIVWPNH